MFNNPVDIQQIMTLARQMYPENPKHLLRHFKEVTSKPYGYLLIDLKPTPPKHLRLRTDVLAPIKSNKTGDISRYLKDAPESQMYLKPPTTDQLWTFSEQTEASIPSKDAINSHTNLISPSIDQLHIFSEQTEATIFSWDMPSCDDCGILFENMHALQRHIKRWCPENFPLK